MKICPGESSIKFYLFSCLDEDGSFLGPLRCGDDSGYVGSPGESILRHSQFYGREMEQIKEDGIQEGQSSNKRQEKELQEAEWYWGNISK